MSLPLFSQQSAKLDSVLQLPHPPEERIALAEAFLVTEKENDSIAYLHNQFAYWLYDYDLKKTIAYEEKARTIGAIKNSHDTLFLQKSNMALGFYLRKDGNYLDAISTYRNVVLLNKQNLSALKAYYQLGYCYENIYNYPKAIKNYELYTTLFNESQIDIRKKRNAHYNIAVNSLKINTKEFLQKGIEHIEIADSLAMHIPTRKDRLYQIKNCYAELYNQHLTLDIEKSYHYYQQAFDIARELKDTLGMRDALFGKGSLFNTSNQDKSIKYLNESLALTHPEDSLRLYLSFSDLGLTYGYKKEFDKSIAYLQKSLPYLTGKDFNTPISIFLFSQTPYKQQLLYVIPLMAKTYLSYYEENKDPALLEKSLSYFFIADEMIDFIKTNSDEFTSRLFWRETSSRLYGAAIRACYLKNDIEKAFYFMEKNKALLILEDISNQQYIEKLGLPEAYFKEEKELLSTIYQFERQIKSPSLSKKEKEHIQKELIDTRLAMDVLKESHGISKNTLQPVDIETLPSVQKKLTQNEIIVEYNITPDDGFGIYSNNDNGYALFISKDNISFFEITGLPRLQKDLEILLPYIKTPFKTQEDVANYTALSNRVYRTLFPSKEIRQFIKGRKLTIISDYFLSYIPFEALSISKDKLTFLITQNEVSYLYSNSFLQNTQNSDRSHSKFLAVAPSHFWEDHLSKLSFNKEEVQSLDRYFNGTSLLDEAATKEQFIRLLPERDIVHLATHADAQNEESPWIAFSDDKLTLEELYIIKNNASLVLLSGCNTNLGKQELGEGVMSLARGFFYGGSQSVISSLWSIDDRSTSGITSSFYDNLSDGQTKSEALHNAKLDYIASHGFSEASPYYWASFVLLGQNDTIQTPQPYWLYLLLFVSLGIIFLFFLKRIKTQGKK